MLTRLKNSLRRRLRGIQRGGCFPIFLPHHKLSGGTITSSGQQSRPIGPGLSKALALCDGTRTLARIARQSGCARSDLIAAQDDGLIILWRSAVPLQPPALQGRPHAIILSPHLDDAALSCGGRMLGDRTSLAVNIFSQSVWWRFALPGDPEQIRSCRLAEENLIARLAGVAMQNLDLPEALLRGHAMENVFTDAPDARDTAAIAQVADSITQLARTHPLAHWYLPLGTGGHLDHRIVRDTALQTLTQSGIKLTHIHLYEDLPYAAEGKTSDFAQAHPALQLTRELLEIDHLIHWKLELLRTYWSQFTWSRIIPLKRYAQSIGDGEAAEVTWVVGRRFSENAVKR